MNKNTIVIIVLVALIIVSGVQAFQLVDLRNDLSDGVKVGSSSKPSSSSSAALPSSLDNLPTMVGGC